MKREKDFNFGWRFALEDETRFSGQGFDDSKWRELRLPHDWSVGFSFDKEKGEGATGYLVGGIGWYRKHFPTPEGGDDVSTFVVFDGVYNNSEFWVNGHKLGFHPYGYSPIKYDLTPYLTKDGSDNVIAVRVDHSRYCDSRWYTGSGIYRNVKLVTVSKVHVPIWGTFVTTPEVSAEKAEVSLEYKLRNDSGQAVEAKVTTRFYCPGRYEVASVTDMVSLSAGSEATRNQKTSIANPHRWDLETPELYKAVTTVIVDDEILDTYDTVFGIRSIRFDPNEGFFLNGRNELIKGVCLHHDAGLVGAAVPKEVWRRRFQALKDGGCNAIRIAHNPGSTEFIDLCDEMGLLVQNEFFDEWDNPKDKRLNKEEQEPDYLSEGYTRYFQEWAEADLKAVMLRDRNHPSIIQWSIGNEIEWTYPRDVAATGFFNMSWEGNYFWEHPPRNFEEIKEAYDNSPADNYTLADTAKKLAAWTRELDTSRPVIANCILPSVSHVTGYGEALDIVGYSYRRVMYDLCHENFPDKVIMGTENLGQWHEWKAIEERPHICGTFLWTGIDYMGEVNKQWPVKALAAGLLDVGGFKKPSFHMMKTLWNKEEPHVYLATQTLEKSINKIDEESGEIVAKDPKAWEQALWIWHDMNESWNYEEGEMIAAEVYSNCEEVELFLNGESLGVKRLEDFEDRIYKWAVPFAAGKLEAVGRGGAGESSCSRITDGDAAAIELSVDKPKLAADSYDAAHIVAQLKDVDGNDVVCSEAEIKFEVSGDCEWLGVDNGARDNVQDFQAKKIVTNRGRCLAIVRAGSEASNVTVTAKAEGLPDAVATIEIG
ncbi:glycoside hydrolase family 2 TIM barrel-domain containing protein [Pelagicoccus mobilis]|uniref:DUF4982 domain-containing protein n=1 Tax=Pelagicoccus mobilis TaxID=415221 RepID=A0A934VS16_9BACT|nr:glycoside hydrolase family 2 TIM barrel-domain containing protein [Pelagicoccus mobilis]MBK1878540.1 DUF4982 domain-containing protein [Pelagicoccus mobilis]